MDESKQPKKTQVRKILSDVLLGINIDKILNYVLAIAIVFALTSILMRWQYSRIVDDSLDQMEQVLNTIYAYMATATNDEYADIADEIHHSLILRSLGLENMEYINMIPNTSTDCPLDTQHYQPGPFLVSVNTGEMYSLAVYDDDRPASKAGEYGNMSTDGGHDDVSQTNMFFMTLPDDGTMSVSLSRDDGEISVMRIKQHFCDDCIAQLADTLVDKSVLELVIYDPDTHAIYPIVESAEYVIGDYCIDISRDTERRWNDYDLDVTYVG